MTHLALTAIVCTHNPRMDYLEQTLDSIRGQTRLPDARHWELIVIDNASTESLDGRLDLSWHPNARVVREEKLGLTWARLRSFVESKGEILVFIDDDNVLDASYLASVFAAFRGDAKLGAAGGKVIPRYETTPPAWFGKLDMSLACRDLGNKMITASWCNQNAGERCYPSCAPIGAGMAVRRSAYAAYVTAAAKDPVRAALGRRGIDLASGEDNDIVMSLLEQGSTVAYLPELQLEHLIPVRRLTADYLARYAYSSNRTWVQVLDVHGIRPWPAARGWTAPLRKARAYVRNRAWAAPANRIRWCGACGTIDGQTLISASR